MDVLQSSDLKRAIKVVGSSRSTGAGMEIFGLAAMADSIDSEMVFSPRSQPRMACQIKRFRQSRKMDPERSGWEHLAVSPFFGMVSLRLSPNVMVSPATM